MLPTHVPSSSEERPWWRPQWYELLPEAVLAVALTAFLIDETDAATSAFRSGRALALMAAVGAAWMLGRVVLARSVPWPWARAAVFAVAAVVVLAVVVLPAYDDDTVVETFPDAQVASPAAAPTAPGPTTAASVTAAPAAPVATATPVTTATRATTPATTPTTTPAAPTPAPGPVRLRVGSFRGVDHRASGTVALYRQADGRFVVGLEDFDIQPGPDYDVYVVPGADREDRAGGTRLDDLRGNRGTQYYDVPAGVDLSDGTWSVLIWCQTFAVPVATATPS